MLAVSSLDARDAALAAGADAFLQKPIDPLVLVSTVQDLFRSSAFVESNLGRGAVTERLPSGDPKLDSVLGGGLPANSIAVVAGAPGSGKTILAHQYAFANATREKPALYLTTVSEPFDKVLRYGQTLSFFDARLVGETVFYEDLGTILASRGLTAALDRIDALTKERRPGVIVIDSFTAFRDFAADDGEYRRFLHALAGRLSAFPATSFWLGEYDGDDLRAGRSSPSPTRSCICPPGVSPSASSASSKCASCAARTS